MTTPARTAVRRLVLGRAISGTGTFAAGTALTFTIYERTHSTAWITATMLLTWAVIGFFGPISGAIGDRFDRRRVMIVGESAAAVCWLAMGFVSDHPTTLLAIASPRRCSRPRSSRPPPPRSPTSPARRTSPGRTACSRRVGSSGSRSGH